MGFGLGVLVGSISAIAGAVISQYLFDLRTRKMFLLDKYENTVIRTDMIILKLNSVFDYIKLVEKGSDPLNQYEKTRDILYNEELIKEVALLRLTYCYNNAFKKYTYNITIFTLDIIVHLRDCMSLIQNGKKIDMKKLQEIQNSLHERYTILSDFTKERIEEESEKNTVTHIMDLLLKPFKILTP